MTAETPAFSDVATTASDYDGSYYTDRHLGGHGAYSWESEEWRNFFTGAAERLVAMFEPATALDVGCAKGLLVQALVLKGVDAVGTDIADYAIENSHPDVRRRLSVRSATEAIEGRYDLVSCIEVLEHMSPQEAQQAIDSMCAATDRILFSSTPADFAETTHVNVRPTAQWAAWFAERGFYRRVDVDMSFLTPWAIVFERGELSKPSIVERYESYLSPLNLEVVEKRKALLELGRRVAAQGGGPRMVDLDDDALLARHAELTARDNVIGLEATITRLENDLRNARTRVRRLRERLEKREEDLAAMKASRSWRLGRLITRPLGRRTR